MRTHQLVEVLDSYTWHGIQMKGLIGTVTHTYDAEHCRASEDIVFVRFRDGSEVPFLRHEIHPLSHAKHQGTPGRWFRPGWLTVAAYWGVIALVVTAAVLLMLLWPTPTPVTCPNPGDNERAAAIQECDR